MLRPSFAALVAAEEELGPLFALVERAADGRLRLAEMAGLFFHCAAGGRRAARASGSAQAIAEQGLARATPALKALLTQILQGRVLATVREARLGGGLAGALLGWRPDEFWRATPAELAAVLEAMSGGEAPAPVARGSGAAEGEVSRWMKRSRRCWSACAPTPAVFARDVATMRARAGGAVRGRRRPGRADAGERAGAGGEDRQARLRGSEAGGAVGDGGDRRGGDPAGLKSLFGGGGGGGLGGLLGTHARRDPARRAGQGDRRAGRAGRPYLVGERGPELFVPTASGRIETRARAARATSG